MQQRVRRFFVFAAVLVLAFALPLMNLAGFAFNSDLFSHVLLVPAISAWLVWRRRDQLSTHGTASPMLAGLAVLAGVAALATGFALGAKVLPLVDRLCLQTLAFFFFLNAGALYFIGREAIRPFAFAAAFMIFIVPFPTCFTNWLEISLQHWSADAAALLFGMSGTTVSRDELSFTLPGISVHVAQECSGIHSTVVLFITSLIGGHLLLKSKVNRAMLALVVLPLAVARNGFRIFILAVLASSVNPAVLESALHRKGGPLFFAMSLVPFLALLWLLIKLENRKRT